MYDLCMCVCVSNATLTFAILCFILTHTILLRTYKIYRAFGRAFKRRIASKSRYKESKHNVYYFPYSNSTIVCVIVCKMWVCFGLFTALSLYWNTSVTECFILLTLFLFIRIVSYRIVSTWASELDNRGCKECENCARHIQWKVCRTSCDKYKIWIIIKSL